MKFKKGILQYNYEKNSDGNSIIYAHRLQRLLAFVVDSIILLVLSTLIGWVLWIVFIGPLINKAQSKGVSGNVDFFLYAWLIIICCIIWFIVASILLARYSSKHSHSFGQKLFSLQLYDIWTNQPATWDTVFGREILFQVIFWLSLLFIIPTIILVIFTLLYTIIKSSKKMRREQNTYLWYNTTKNNCLLPYIPQ